MDSNEMERLQKGQKLLGKIKKLDVQIESLNDVTFINLGTDQQKSKSNNYTDWKYGLEETERVVNYNIAINVNDKVPHPFSGHALGFIKSLQQLLNEQRVALQKQFDEL